MCKKEVEAFTVGYTDNTCTVSINGTRYVYRPNQGTGYTFYKKFDYIAEKSMGKAVQWAIKNGEVVEKYEV